MRAADHVMLPSRHRPRPEDLIFDMHWGFPPEPRVEGVRGGDMRPPAPPPEGWEETVRRTRYLRGRVHGTLTAWGRRREGLVVQPAPLGHARQRRSRARLRVRLGGDE